MATTKVSETLARPARTAMQATPALVVTEGIDSFLYDLSEKQYGALVALLTLVFGLVQNFTEERLGKAVLRDIPEPDVPVVDDNG